MVENQIKLCETPFTRWTQHTNNNGEEWLYYKDDIFTQCTENTQNYYLNIYAKIPDFCQCSSVAIILHKYAWDPFPFSINFLLYPVSSTWRSSSPKIHKDHTSVRRGPKQDSVRVGQSDTRVYRTLHSRQTLP